MADSKIVVLDEGTIRLPGTAWAEIAAQGERVSYESTPPQREQILERCAGATVILTNKVPLRREVLRELPDLRLISVLATGVNNIDVAAAREQGITVCNAAGYSSESTAQHTFALILELANQAGAHARSVAAGDWTRSPHFCYWLHPMTALAGKTLGIVGFGEIGRRVGEIAHAFAMRVLASMRSPRDAPAYEPFGFASNEEIFRRADIVSLHCPQTPENTGFVNGALLRTMKPTAWLINCARGPLVHEYDLREALDNGTIEAAALDVVSREPIEAGNPLLGARNCLITPHIAWATDASRRKLLAITAENIRAFFAGEPINVVS